MKNSATTSRRSFFKIAAAGAAVPFSLPVTLGSAANTRLSANDRIRIALIGSGGRGMGITRSALQIPGVELVAAADCYDGRLTRMRELFGREVFTTRDYQEILSRSDVDAVLIATPDHWHAAISVAAMKAGKDVYCEKPMVQTIEQGHAVVRTQKETGRILEVGSQRVSSVRFAKAKEILHRGDLGTVNLVEASINRNSALGAWQYSLPPDASEKTVDWDRFLGPAPRRPFDPVRFFRWRNYWDYGTGIPGDLFVHLLSGIHYLFDSAGPNQIQSTGGLRFWNDGRDVPDVVVGLYSYPASGRFNPFNVVLSVNLADGSNSGSPLRIIGSEGILEVDSDIRVRYRSKRGAPGYSIGTFPESVQREFLTSYRKAHPETEGEFTEMREEVYQVPGRYDDTVDHLRVFFEAVRKRTGVVEDAVFGLRAAAPAILCNTCYLENRICQWDPQAMTLKA